MDSQYDDIENYLDITAIVAVNKYDRLLRKCHNILKDKRYLEEEKAGIKFLLTLDKLQIIHNYSYYYSLVKNIYKSKECIPKEKNDVVAYLNERAYITSYMIIKEKVTNQVRYWVRNKDVMIFETLTIADEWLGNKEKLKIAIREYKRGLNKNGVNYIFVFERGAKKGRPHFHVLYNKADSLGVQSHGTWNIGSKDVVRVRYLNDGDTSEKVAMEKGWYTENIIGYITKYISKENSEERSIDEYHYRTHLSRGFGTCQMRMKLIQTKTETLKEMVKSRLPLHQGLLLVECQKELARRLSITRESLMRESMSTEGSAIAMAVGSQEPISGYIRKTTAKRFEGFEDYERTF